MVNRQRIAPIAIQKASSKLTIILSAVINVQYGI